MARAAARAPEGLLRRQDLDTGSPARTTTRGRKATVMHLKEHSHRYERTEGSDAQGTDAYLATCTCGEWEHSRWVNPDDPLDRAEVESAWFAHANPGVRL